MAFDVTITATPNARMRAERYSQGLSMRDLAHFADCSISTVSAIEHGRMNASAAMKARIARVLRVPVRELWPEG